MFVISVQEVRLFLVNHLLFNMLTELYLEKKGS